MSIASRLVLLVVLISLSLGISTVWVTEKTAQSELEQLSRQWSQILAGSLGESLALDAVNRNTVRAQQTLKTITKGNELIEFAFLTDFDGRVFAHTFTGGFPASLLKEIQTRPEEVSRIVRLQRDRAILVRDRIIRGLDAEIFLGINARQADNAVLELSGRVTLPIIFISIAAILISLLLGRQLVRPLQAITHRLQRYNSTAPGKKPAAGDEVKALVDAFNNMEASRQESEERFRATFEQAAMGIALVSPAGDWMDVNHKLCEIVGYSHDELLQLTFQDITHPEDLNTDLDYVRRMLHGELDTYQMEKRYIRKDGKHIWVMLTVALVRDDAGKPKYFISVVDDIQTRKMAEREIQQFKSTLDSTIDCVFMFEPEDLRFFYVNHGAMQQVGYSEDELLRMTPVDIKPEYHEPGFRALLQPLLDGKTPSVSIETFHRHKDGHDIPVAISLQYITPNNASPRFVAIVRDITEEKKIRDALMRSQETYARAEAISHVGSWDWNMEDNSLHWTDEIYRIFGLNPQQFGATYEAFLERVHPDDRQAVIDAVNASVADAEIPYSIQHRVVQPNGAERLVHERGKVYRDESSQPVRMIGTVHDITKQEKARRELEYNQARFAAMYESISDAVIVANTDRRIVLLNKSVSHMFGYENAELIGETTEKLYASAADFRQTGSDRYNEQATAENTAYEIQYRRKDGSMFWGETLGSKIESAEGKVFGFIGIIRDITERKLAEQELQEYRDLLELRVQERTAELVQAQQELVRKERLATLGQLTATVSHELRNPLGAMRPSLYVIRKSAANGDDRMLNAIDRVERNIARCDHIVDELLDFTRIRDLEISSIEIDKFVREVVKEQSIPSEVCVEINTGLADTRLEIDPHRLRRALINVIDNACQAMQREEGDNTVVDGARLHIETREKNDRIEIVISDNGSGIPNDVLPHIFEPLYSTKGFGVGLGLPTVKHIMQQHGGDIEVVTRSGKGTEMILWLPVGK